MERYKLSSDVTTEKLEQYGFVVDTFDENAKRKNYLLYRKLEPNSHLAVEVKQIGHKLKFKPFSGIKLYLNGLDHASSLHDIEKKYGDFYFSTTLEGVYYNRAMNDLEQSGILVKKLKRK